MPSWQSMLFKGFLVMRRTKQKFLDVSLMEEYVAQRLLADDFRLKESFLEKHQIREKTHGTMTYYVINEQDNPEKVIYYFHGGAYINDPLILHWLYLLKIANATNFMIVVPIYPKLPKYKSSDCYEMVHALYDELTSHYQVPFIFKGDSAGGGLALGFAQDVRNVGKQQPEQIVLLSPWLDMTAQDPQYEELERLDPMIGIKGARYLAELWREDEEITHYRLSPLFGDLTGLGRIVLFVGTAELLLVDARKLVEKAMAQGVDIHYFEYDKMNHVFPVYPIPEAKKALQTLVPFLLAERV